MCDCVEVASTKTIVGRIIPVNGIYLFLDPKHLLKQMILQTVSDNSGEGETGIWCSIEFLFFGPKIPAKTDDFAEYVQISTFLLKLPLKLSISWSFLSDGSGRVGRVGGFGIPKKCENNTRINHFYTQFEAPILVTVNFEWESLASVATDITKNETKRRK